MSNLSELIERHYKNTHKVWPDVWRALAFMDTEKAEAYELLLNRDPTGWMRNNPDDKEPYSPERFEEELGDMIMMTQVAGMVMGLDPLRALVEKLGGVVE